LIQIIDIPHGRSISNFIDIKDLADWMSRYIPQYAQSNLKIHLLVCSSIDIAAALMGALNSQGFKKTSVVGYIGAQSTMYTDANTITDFSTAERTYNKTHYHHGRRFNSNKKVSHNYSGELILNEDYHFFKNRYFLQSLIDKDKDKEEYRVTQLLEVITPLIEAVNNYRSANFVESEDGANTFNHKHGSSGFLRSNYLSNALRELQVSCISTTPEEDIISKINEKSLIDELISFISKTENYRNFRGNINVNNTSCLSYIEEALLRFYIDNHSDNISSNLLKQFLIHLFGRDINGLPRDDFLSSEHKSLRMRIRERFKSISQEMIDQW
jgi:hypothetical protein